MGRIRSAVLSVLAAFLLAVPGLSAEEKTDEQIKKDYLTAGLNRKGAEFYDRKKWDQALYNFEKAHEVNPTNSVIRKNLIATYGEVALEETALRRWERVPPFQEKALRIVSDPEDERIFWSYYARFLSRIAQEAPPDKWRELSAGVPDASVPREFKPPVSGMLHNLAVEAYRRKDTKNARAFALRSLQLKPFYETYLLLGNLYQQEERLEEARGAFLAARGLKKTKEADERLRKVEEEIRLSRRLQEFQTGHFILRLERRSWEERGGEISKELEEAYSLIARDFQTEIPGRVVVLFYDPTDFFRMQDISSWSGGLYDGKIRIPFKPGYWEKRSRQSVYHELTHAFLFEAAGDRLPLWLQEGLAQTEEDRVEKVPLQVFAGARQTGALLTLREMTDHPPSREQGIETALFYQQSFMVTRYLLEKYGWDALLLLLKKVKRRVPFEQAFFEMTAKDFEAFQIEWLAHFKKRPTH